MNLTVKLNAEFDRFVNQLVESGTYATPGEVVREALQLLKDREFLREHKLRSLRNDVEVAKRQVKRGQFRTFNTENLHQLTESIKKEGRKQLAQEKKSRNGS
jgi:antitoxin ParD1/3/4